MTSARLSAIAVCLVGCGSVAETGELLVPPSNVARDGGTFISQPPPPRDGGPRVRDAGFRPPPPPPPPRDAGVPSGDILDRLRALPGVTVTETFSGPPNARSFEIWLDQPVDHDRPDAQRFRQRITLVHRHEARPMIFATTGYWNFYEYFTVELTEMLRANQIVVEHRYFDRSRPVPTDWAFLTVEQAARDHHRIAEALKPIYGAAWLSTGASKGGMTSVYHRRFFPNDVDGTVAYVAPISFGVQDARYPPFFATVGDPDCRAEIKSYARNALLARPDIEQVASNDPAIAGRSFTYQGSVEAALESRLFGFEWTFWQYLDEADCGTMPGPNSPPDDYWFFLRGVGLGLSADDVVDLLVPYYVQSARELGGPARPSTAHIDDLRRHGGWARSPYPPGVDLTFDASTMVDIDTWVRTQGEGLMFVYGENDPWTAGAFELGAARDSYSFTAPGTNHGAAIRDLGPQDQMRALDVIERWTGVRPRLNANVAPAEREPRFLPIP